LWILARWLLKGMHFLIFSNAQNEVESKDGTKSEEFKINFLE
jgi:hypothetical protein